MLAWTKANGFWLGNGYRIVPDPPSAWELYDVSRDVRDSQVAVESAPLASLPTLSAAKYKAEILHRKAQTTLLRKRLSAVAAGAIALILVLAPNPLLVVACGVVAAASVLELVMTWYEELVGDARELHQ